MITSDDRASIRCLHAGQLPDESKAKVCKEEMDDETFDFLIHSLANLGYMVAEQAEEIAELRKLTRDLSSQTMVLDSRRAPAADDSHPPKRSRGRKAR